MTKLPATTARTSGCRRTSRSPAGPGGEDAGALTRAILRAAQGLLAGHRRAQREPQFDRGAVLSVEQAAAVLGISPRTAYRDWAFAQAWLYREVRGAEPPSEK